MARVRTYCKGDAVVAGNNGVPAFVQVDLNCNVLAGGGTATTAIAAATSTTTVVKASADRLCRILIQATVSTNPIEICDNASAASGVIIGYISATAPAGVYDFEMPATHGITVRGASTNPAMTIRY